MTVQELNNLFGENLAYYRKKSGLTKEGLSRQMGLSQSHVGIWEAGRALPKGENLIMLAMFFGIEVWQLFYPCTYNIPLSGKERKPLSENEIEQYKSKIHNPDYLSSAIGKMAECLTDQYLCLGENDHV